MDKETYTIAEAMPIFGVSKTTITYWINVGIVDAKKEKGKWIIDGQSMKDWQEFKKVGLSAASEEMQKRFKIASENFKAMQKERHDKTMSKRI